jgi:anti-anti-sigma factor
MSICSVTTHESAPLVVLHGDLLADVVPEVRTALLPLLTPAATIHIDCAAVNVVDAMGLGLLIATHQSVSAQQGTLVLRGLTPELRAFLQLLRLEHRFQIDETQA